MPSADFLSEIYKKLPPVEAQSIIKRLRIDGLVWGMLQEEGFVEKAIQMAGSDPNAWSPAKLARLAMGDVFISTDKWTLKPEDAEHAKRLFKEAVRDHRVPTDLKEAGFLAIALLDQWKETEPLINMLETNAGEPENQVFAIWKTPLVCLYGMVADPKVMMRALLPKRGGLVGIAWISHCVLCNPIEQASQVQILANFMAGFSPIQQVNWMRYLQLAGHSGLVSALANTMLGKLPVASAPQLSRHIPEKTDLEVNVVRLLELLRMVGLYRYSGQTANARGMGLNAQRILEHLRAGIELQMADLDAQEKHEIASKLREVVKSSPDSVLLATESMMELGGDGSRTVVLNSISDEVSSPMIEIHRAKALFDQGAEAMARERAGAAVSQFIDKFSQQPLGMMTQFLLDWQPGSMIKLLMEMNLTSDALRCTEKLLESRPLDIELLELASEIYQNQLHFPQALSYTRFLQIMQPVDPDRVRKSANLLEISGQWAEAKLEREHVLKMAPAQLEDWVALGRCQLHLGQWESVLTSCEEIFRISPENGKACALKGQALLALGNQPEAQRLLNQATLLAPEEAEPWLALFRMQKEAGEENRAIDTLKAAVLAVTDSADINFELAKSYIHKGLFTEGLPFLRKAAKLAPDSIEVTLDLGKTLAALGYYEEARKIFEQGRQRWSTNAELAYAYAEIILPLGERENALQALEVALQGEACPADWYVLFARILTETEAFSVPNAEYDRYITAQLGLEKVLANSPDHLEASILKADVICARGDYAKAYELYKELIERCESQPSFRWRVQAGLGEAALHLGLVDNALVALKEALQSKPDQPKLHRLLAEAYQAGDLGQEAAVAARYALKLNPDHLDTLAWFASFTAQLGEIPEAILALRTATQLAPEKSVYWIGLAELNMRQQNSQEAEDALKTFMGLASISTEALRRAGKAYLTLDKPEEAWECLVRAVKGEANPDGQLWIELTYLSQLIQKDEYAVDALQQAMSRLAGINWMVVLQSDLMVKLGRLEAASACLERAQQTPVARSNSRPLTQVIKSGIIPAEWLEDLQQPYAINLRFALLERRKGHLAKSLAYIEAALDTRPDQVELHCLAADIACATLLPQRGVQLADVALLHQTPIVIEGTVSAAAVTTLLCELAEMALNADELGACEGYIQKGETLLPNFQRLLAIKVRLAVKQGDWLAAISIYSHLNENVIQCETGGCDKGVYALEPELLPAYWRMETALDVMDWESAVKIGRNLLQTSNEPRMLLGWIKTTVLSAEAMQISKDLQLVHHSPQENCLNTDAYEMLEKTLNQLEGFANPLLIERWQVRGRAAFRPSNATLRVLGDLLPGEQEAAALISGLRSSNNLSGAIEVAKDYPNSTIILRQLTLCYLSTDPLLGLKAANRAAELELNHPIHQALLAITLYKNGFLPEGLEAWETALSVWDNEPYWQEQAARLATEIGELSCATEHWEKATELVPNNLEFSVELCKVYLKNGESQKALDALNRALQIDEQRADLWYLKAEAFRQLKRLSNALTCAEKSMSFEPEAILPIILYGEITLQMGNTDLAMEESRKALVIEPNNEAAILFQVKVYEAIGKSDEGLNLLEKSITPESSTTMVLIYARLVYQQRGAQSALPLLKKICETDPDQVGVLNLMAHAQEECGELDGAEETVFKALQIEPNQADLNQLMGRLKRISGQLDQSVHFLSEAIRQDPEKMDAYLELGKTYQDRREMAQALNTYEKAIQADSQDHRPYYQAGIVLRECKDYKGAETMLRRASELVPQDVNIRRLLGAVVTLNLIHSSQETGTINENLSSLH